MSASVSSAEPLDEPGLERALADLKSVLIPEETLQAWAVQRRLFALPHRRVLVAATTGRLIWLNRKLVGGFDLGNIRWQDFEQVNLHVGVLSATLTVIGGQGADLASADALTSRRVEFTGLRKAQAQAIYRICQAQDQAWREKRRIRDLEELRARSGGMQLNAGGFAGAGAAGGSDSLRRLQEAKQMLDARLISDSEYEAIKARILASG